MTLMPLEGVLGFKTMLVLRRQTDWQWETPVRGRAAWAVQGKGGSVCELVCVGGLHHCWRKKGRHEGDIKPV